MSTWSFYFMPADQDQNKTYEVLYPKLSVAKMFYILLFNKARGRYLYNLSQKNKIMYFKNKLINTYVIADKDVAEFVLSDEKWHFDRTFDDWKILSYYLGLSGINATNDRAVWKKRKADFQNIFKASNLDLLAKRMDAIMDSTLDQMSKYSISKKTINIQRFVNQFALECAVDSFLRGLDINIEEYARQLHNALYDVTDLVNISYATLAKVFKFIVKGHYARAIRYKKMLKKSIREFVSSEDNNNVINIILKSEKEQRLLQKSLYDEVQTFLSAGHLTTSSAVSRCMIILSQNPEWAKRIANEYSEVTANEPLCFSTLKKLEFTRSFFFEVLRLYPPVSCLLRRTTKDISYHNITFLKGNYVNTDFSLIHRHPDYWENPTQFDPERFLGEGKKLLATPAYLPFSYGSRSCIARNFAVMEACIFLGKFCQRYIFELNKDNPLDDVVGFTNFPKSVKGRIYPRHISA